MSLERLDFVGLRRRKMTLLIVLPLMSLASFIVLARYIANMSTASLGVGFVMWIAWTGICGRAFSAVNSLHVQILWVVAELIPPLVLAVIFKRKLREIPGLIRTDFQTTCESLVGITKSIWIMPVVLAAVIVLYSIGLVANIQLPQTMDDSVTAYLARAGFWISNHSTEFFRTSDYNFPLVSYPALPTFSTLRWIVVSGGDHAAALDQWIATIISGSLVFSLARKARISHAVSMLGALLWLLMPVTLLQSQMVLNDMVAMVAVLTTVILASNLFTEFRKIDFLAALLAAFVAIGTKQTILFMAPSALLTVVIGLVVFRKSQIIRNILQIRLILFGISVVVVGFVLAVPEYLSNLRRYKHPLGPEESFGYFANVSAGFDDRISGIIRNVRQVFTAGLFGDVPLSVSQRFSDFYESIRRFYPEAGFEVSRASGVGWFGFSVTFLVLFGVPITVLIVLLRRRGLSVLMLGSGAAVYTLFFMYTRSNFSEAFSRYMLFPFTLSLIVGLVLIDTIWKVQQGTFARYVGQIAIASLAAVSIWQGSWSFLGNGVRPLAGPNQVWSKSDDDIMYLSNGFADGGAFVPMIEKLNSCDPSLKPLGIYLPYKFPLAQLFGASYDRKVTMVDIPAETTINLGYLASNDLSALIVDDVIKPTVLFDMTGLWSQSYGQYTLVIIPSEKSGCD
jgi:hypothetical protein